MNALRRLMLGVLGTLFVVLNLSGCATFKEDAGYVVQAKSADTMRQEPWHNVTLMGDIRTVESIGVAVYNLPEPLPAVWQDEFVDVGRSYVVKQVDGTQKRQPLVRVVERALLYSNEGKLIDIFDAVFFPNVKRFYVLLPADRALSLRGHQMVIVSSDGTWLMTGMKEVVDLPKGQDLRQLPPGFFQEHPSELRQVLILKRPDPVLADLTWRFDEHFTVHGVSYSGLPGARTVLSRFTSLTMAVDKVISCGSFTLSPGMAAIGVAISVARNVYIANQKDCLAGKKTSDQATGIQPADL